LYLTSDFAVVQLDAEQCASYRYCTHCDADPYCFWDVGSATCQRVDSKNTRWFRAFDWCSVYSNVQTANVLILTVIL